MNIPDIRQQVRDVPAKLRTLVDRMFATRSGNTSAQPEAVSWDAMWRGVQVKHTRTEISRDVWRMYREDDRVRAAIDGLGGLADHQEIRHFDLLVFGHCPLRLHNK